MTHDVFISHSSKDKVIADAVCAKLEAAKVRCWIAPRDIRSGENWARAITRAIKNSTVMVLIFSEHSNQSDQVANEVTLAFNSQVVVVPFKIDDILPSELIEYYLASTHWLDAMNPPTEKELNNLVDVVGSFVGRADRSPASAPSTEEVPVKAKAEALESDSQVHAAGQKEDEPGLKEQSQGKLPGGSPVSAFIKGNKPVLAVAALLLAGFLIYGGINLFSSNLENGAVEQELGEEVELVEDAAPEEELEEAEPVEEEVVGALFPSYYIDPEEGTVSLSELPVGARVVDYSWEWEFRTGANYTYEDGNVAGPVVWIVVAKNHYDGMEPHVTLVSEELIGRFMFAYFEDVFKFEDRGDNNWQNVATVSNGHALRPWLNSTGIYSNEGFYQAFSDQFKAAVLTTTVPNRDWEHGSRYTTEDMVFIPSITELGGTDLDRYFEIGKAYAYYKNNNNMHRIAYLGDKKGWYWTRTPNASNKYELFHVNSDGGFNIHLSGSTHVFVRPVLNLKHDIMVSEHDH